MPSLSSSLADIVMFTDMPSLSSSLADIVMFTDMPSLSSSLADIFHSMQQVDALVSTLADKFYICSYWQL